ncbi:sarcosine oxidase subunit gamma [Sulfitobacter donghicola]|uniref:Sarcosine oxidase subunit gamma n=1 Tax=Sulfitobacter donghicola DSW-25 = KCTC 12864 = JCM 14565 TaxID=1300350 RepID=A0A073IKK8_9RHOB|nr:sarcosine oxidase subunit gamma family protein [Sulfitobacter donghicola]KEJ90090.1 sarcosine oxidase subunit gamma [Sulfitobacter donghicola DSW-25 = KCTC 12864 = JCM 14565]KIN66760.1 Sarcosine oxidase, gamma subunit family [Sulfitobacter donghicola DSW-25 = KCTC 12864 = JCM 14565]
MSDPVSALNNASFDAGIATLRERGPVGMITLRGDLSSKPVQKAVKAASGLAMPQQRQCLTIGENSIAWMSPDELLIVCPYAEAASLLADIQGRLANEHALAVNVSDARAVFEVSGPNAREVMAKLAPVDLAPSQFTPEMFRRTRIAQVAAAFWMPADDVFHVVCFRSVAQYVFDALSIAAQPGSEVDVF